MGLPKYGPSSFCPTFKVPDGLAFTCALLVGAAVGAGADLPPDDGTAVAAVVDFVSLVDGTGVAVAEEPHARMAAKRRAKGPRIISLGFFNQ